MACVALTGFAVAAVAGSRFVREPSPGTRASGPRSGQGSGQALRDVDAGPAAGAVMVDRLQLFRTGNAGDRMTLDGPELTAILRHSAPGLIPQGVSVPAVFIERGAVRITARVALSVFPSGWRVSSLHGVLPDTLDVELVGDFMRDGQSGLVFRVVRASAQGLVIPRPVVASMVASIPLGRPDGVRVPRTANTLDGVPAIGIPWPDGVGSVRVGDDRLVLRRPERITDRVVDGSGSP